MTHLQIRQIYFKLQKDAKIFSQLRRYNYRLNVTYRRFLLEHLHKDDAGLHIF